MIDFACKKIDIADIIMCSHGLSRTEYAVLMALMGPGGLRSVSEIAASMGLERTTVQKALAALLSKKLTQRRQLNLSGGGYAYRYSALPKEVFRAGLIATIGGWHKKATEEIAA